MPIRALSFAHFPASDAQPLAQAERQRLGSRSDIGISTRQPIGRGACQQLLLYRRHATYLNDDAAIAECMTFSETDAED